MTRSVLFLRSVAALGAALGVTVCARPAAAQTLEPRSYTVRGFDVLASAGWGATTGTIGDLELAPYGATFGVDVGYTWSVGFRLGAHFDGALGHEVVEQREPRIGRESEFTADSSSLNGGFSVGWDLPIYSLFLRYTVRLGVTAMHWDFRDTRPIPAGFEEASDPVVGLHLAPGVALIWPYRWFEAGIGFDYVAQAENTGIPSGFIGKMLIGVRP